MDMAVSNQQKSGRIHPHKFTLWVAMGSIVMMFAGLTSAYVVRRSQANWLEFSLPNIFIASTIVILFSSLTIHLALKSFKAREMQRYRTLIAITAFLGVLFAVLQFIGFTDLHKQGVQLFGQGSNPSASFLGIITGLHVLHVIGGVIALLVIFFGAFFSKTKIYSPTSLEIVATYWHFVDILWIYLFVFFTWIR
ncbi:MAG: heme-copper oxidase subunit [Chitinophagaceae bacterium]|nr:heme-copper oxidase subunit [Chitinophagaceae bacterium]